MVNAILSLLLIGNLYVGAFKAEVYSQENVKAITRDVYQEVNRYRKGKRLNELKMETALNRIAYQHAWNMAKGKVPFSHQGFEQRIAAVKQFANVPYRVAENLYATKSTSQIARQALKSWIESPGHKENMEDDWIYTGVGVVKSRDGEYFIAQLFVGKQK